ncbi:hypothetical protein L484_018878 [Morus notabilis]|uniref:Uncharacterized protein n=1 Tax=Morus notabilis TaxID=981085 RepID=W9QS96_9ROSA|nr:hypothetical protein L484_018876 [Morus notabilis]EXB52994.1 hypothetical protein L484_018878 [Morus notabilis]
MANYRPVLVLALSLMIISMSSVAHCDINANDIVGTVTGTGTSTGATSTSRLDQYDPIAKVHVFGDLSKCAQSQFSNFNQPPRSQSSVAQVYFTLLCGPKRVAVGQTVIKNPSSFIDFTFDLVDSRHNSPPSRDLADCLVVLSFLNYNACAAKVQPLATVDPGSTVQQVLGIGDQQNFPKYEAKEFFAYN